MREREGWEVDVSIRGKPVWNVHTLTGLSRSGTTLGELVSDACFVLEEEELGKGNVTQCKKGRSPEFRKLYAEDC